MSDLRGALLAAAEEAEKMQKETETRIRYLEDIITDQQNKIDNLDSQIVYVETENHKLKTKLKCAAEHMRSVVNILLEE
jgi:uncharacterized coiled-coil protein SlyX